MTDTRHSIGWKVRWQELSSVPDVLCLTSKRPLRDCQRNRGKAAPGRGRAEEMDKGRCVCHVSVDFGDGLLPDYAYRKLSLV